MVVAALPADNSSQGQPEGDDCSGASSGNGTPGRCQGAQGTENRRMSFKSTKLKYVFAFL